eukprot:scaffold2858_cov659-Pavlova_lutheri.AAC.71
MDTRKWGNHSDAKYQCRSSIPSTEREPWVHCPCEINIMRDQSACDPSLATYCTSLWAALPRISLTNP